MAASLTKQSDTAAAGPKIGRLSLGKRLCSSELFDSRLFEDFLYVASDGQLSKRLAWFSKVPIKRPGGFRLSSSARAV